MGALAKIVFLIVNKANREFYKTDISISALLISLTSQVLIHSMAVDVHSAYCYHLPSRVQNFPA